MSLSQRQSFWEDILFDHKYDLIVIGGGLTGLSTAYFFKKRNPKSKVLVLDRGFFPIGASTRNAGFACIGTIGEFIADLEIDSEDQLRERILKRYDGLQLLREVVGDTHLDYEHTGGYEIFIDQGAFEAASSKIEFFNTWMRELIGDKALYKQTEYLGYPAIYNPSEGMLHPGKMIQRLLHLNSEIGVEFRWNAEVLEIDPEEGKIKVDEDIWLHAERLAVCSNAFTEHLLIDSIIKPGRGFVFITSKLDELAWKGTFHYDKGYVYFRNLGNDRMLIGGGRNVDYQAEETGQFGINTTIRQHMIDFTNRVLKLPKGWEIEREWSGIMGFTETKSPVLELISEKCVVAAGLSGMGVAMGMNLGKSAAGMLG